MVPAVTTKLGIAAIALVLLWRIVQVNVVLYDENGRPALPRAASGALADEAAVSAFERRALVEVLRRDPAEVAALLMLARDDERRSDLAAARTYRAALDLAPLDREVLATAAAFFMKQGAVADAFVLLDKLVDQYPDTRINVFPVMAQLLDLPAYARQWQAAVARNPEWLGAFVLASCERGMDPAMLALLLGRRVLTDTRAAGCIVDRLRKAGRWDEAYQVWLNSLPREQLRDVGFVFNGGFELAPSAMGFDWMLARQPEREVGHAAEIVPALGAVGKRALRVSYNGKRQNGIPAAQYLMLVPGRYELNGRARIDRLRSGSKGVQWTVRCMARDGARSVVASSGGFVGSSEWDRFAFSFEIPRDCRGQVLQLEPASPEGATVFLAGTVWFDDFSIRRVH